MVPVFIISHTPGSAPFLTTESQWEDDECFILGAAFLFSEENNGL